MIDSFKSKRLIDHADQPGVFMEIAHFGANSFFSVPGRHGRLPYVSSRAYAPAEELSLDPRDPELAKLYDWFGPDQPQ